MAGARDGRSTELPDSGSDDVAALVVRLTWTGAVAEEVPLKGTAAPRLEFAVSPLGRWRRDNELSSLVLLSAGNGPRSSAVASRLPPTPDRSREPGCVRQVFQPRPV
jgi:hypothetical protein